MSTIYLLGNKWGDETEWEGYALTAEAAVRWLSEGKDTYLTGEWHDEVVTLDTPPRIEHQSGRIIRHLSGGAMKIALILRQFT